MTRAPTRTDIDVAELRLSRSKQNVRHGLKRTRAALRAAAARPATLGLVAVASGLSAAWIARRLRAAVIPASKGAAPPAGTSARRLAVTFVSSYLAQTLTVVLHEVVVAWRQRAARRDAGSPRSSTPDQRVAAERR